MNDADDMHVESATPQPPEESAASADFAPAPESDAAPAGAESGLANGDVLIHAETSAAEVAADAGADSSESQPDASEEQSAASEEPPKRRTAKPRAPRKTTRPPAAPIEDPDAPPAKMDWYILKVQSNREDSVREALLRKIKIAGLESRFGEVIVPKEQVTEFKGGKKKVTKRKLYPGYIVVNMMLDDETWFLVRETSGIGDFTGSGGKPSPMPAHEINSIIKPPEDKAEEGPKLKISFAAGDRVKVNTGTFENFEGEVHAIDQANGRVTVMLSIFGRSTPVEIDYWEIESI